MFPKLATLHVTAGTYAMSLIKNPGEIVVFFAVADVTVNLFRLSVVAPKVFAINILLGIKNEAVDGIADVSRCVAFWFSAHIRFISVAQAAPDYESRVSVRVSFVINEQD